MRDTSEDSIRQRVEAAKQRLIARTREASEKPKKVSLRAALKDPSLVEAIRSARDGGVSWVEIAAELSETLQVPVNATTLQTYMSQLAPKKPYSRRPAEKQNTSAPASAAQESRSAASRPQDVVPSFDRKVPRDMSEKLGAQSEMPNGDRPVTPRRVK